MEGIAIIGIAERLSGAPDVAPLQRSSKERIDSISRFSPFELGIGGSDEALGAGHLVDRRILAPIGDRVVAFMVGERGLSAGPDAVPSRLKPCEVLI